jgi:hypothetical protein
MDARQGKAAASKLAAKKRQQAAALQSFAIVPAGEHVLSAGTIYRGRRF